MATALRPEQIDDLALVTLRDLGRSSWTDISYELQEYVAMSRMLRQNKVGFSGGDEVQWQVQVTHSGAARNTALYNTDSIGVQNVMKSAYIPWTFQDTHYAYDQREPAFNRGPAAILNLLKVRRHDAMVALAELMETNFWNLPDTGDDNLKPYGLPYWCVTGTTEGFTGLNPTGFSAGAGNIDSTVYPRWSNWYSQYTSVTETDFVRRLRKAATFTKFRTPHAHPSYNRGDNYAFYTNYDVIGVLEEYLRSSNENLGYDVGKYDGKLMFRGNPINWAPYLEDDTTDPLYGINWGVFRPIFQTGEYMRESRPLPVPNNHRGRVIWIDVSCQFECRDRRRLFKIAK